MKNVQVMIATNAAEMRKLNGATGLTLNSADQGAACERAGAFKAQLIVDTSEDESGFFVSVLVNDEEGGCHQWNDYSGHPTFFDAVGQMVRLATMPLADFMLKLQSMNQIA